MSVVTVFVIRPRPSLHHQLTHDFNSAVSFGTSLALSVDAQEQETDHDYDYTGTVCGHQFRSTIPNHAVRASCCSTYQASMAGNPVEQLTFGLQQFQRELASDPLAAKRVEVAVVTFGPVRVQQDFVTADAFLPPSLDVEGATPFGRSHSRSSRSRQSAQATVSGQWRRLLSPLDLSCDRRRTDGRVASRSPRSKSCRKVEVRWRSFRLESTAPIFRSCGRFRHETRSNFADLHSANSLSGCRTRSQASRKARWATPLCCRRRIPPPKAGRPSNELSLDMGRREGRWHLTPRASAPLSGFLSLPRMAAERFCARSYRRVGGRRRVSSACADRFGIRNVLLDKHNRRGARRTVPRSRLSSARSRIRFPKPATLSN